MSEEHPTPGRDPRDRDPANAFLFFAVSENACHSCKAQVVQWRTDRRKKTWRELTGLCHVCTYRHFMELLFGARLH